MAPKVLVSDKLSPTAVQIFRDRGIDVDLGNNMIIRNRVRSCIPNYNIAGGNKDAQVLTPGSDFTSTDPWANFSF